MITDIIRLHSVCLTKYDGMIPARGAGKTFVNCHEICQLVALNHVYIICFITLKQDILYIKDMLHKIVGEYNYNITDKTSTCELKIENAIIKFIPCGLAYTDDEHIIYKLIDTIPKVRLALTTDNNIPIPIVSMGHDG